MGRQHVRGGAVHIRQQKTGKAMPIPLHPALAAVIEATPRNQPHVPGDRVRQAVHRGRVRQLV
jgi:hypothetical protein